MANSRTSLPAIGDVLNGKYRLERVLGEGGYGRVYLATAVGVERQVAIKVLKQTEIKVAIRFKREARAIARLSSPNTLTLFDHGEHNGCLFMVTEFVEGEDLGDRLLTALLTEAELIHVLIQVLGSLEEAHQSGVLHRDIKPANIRLFEYAGDPLRVKVLDFGLAKAVDGREVALTQTGSVIGTPRYMSPEQLTGGAMSPATDVFSLGVVAIECVLGRESMLIADLSNRLTGLQLNDEHPLSAELRRIVNRMLARDLDVRYRSAGAAQGDLIALARSRSGRSKKALPNPPSRPRSTSAPTSRPVVRPADRDGTGPGNVPWAIAAGVCVLGIGVSFVLWSDTEDSETQYRRRVLPAVVAPNPVEATPAEVPARRQRADQTECTPPFIGPGYVEEQTHALDARRYYAYVPEGLPAGQRHPLLVLFHQVGHTGELLAESGGFVEIADKYGVIVLAPTEADFAAWAPQTEHVPVAEKALEVAMPQLCIDEDRVFGVGHGSGAGIAAKLACRGRLAAYATHALSLEKRRLPCHTDRRTPYLMFYPTDSGYEPIEGGETCSGAYRVPVEDVEGPLLEFHECEQVEPDIHDDGTKCWAFDCARAPLKSCHVKGGHGWAGTPIRDIQYRLMDCDGPNPTFPMAQTIWDFFAPLAAPKPPK